MPIISRRHPARAALVALALLGSIGIQAAPIARHAGVAKADSSTLIVDFISDFSHLDPSLCYDTQCYPWMHALYDQLIGYDTARGNGDALVPDAATAMPVVTNGGKTYVFKLRNDVRFWDGKLATAADWVYSFERIINPATKSGAQAFWLDIVGAQAYATGKAPHVSGIKALGKFGLEVDLNSPYVGFLNVLAMPFGSVLEQAQVIKYGKSYDALHPMGTGPYLFTQHTLNQKLILTRNPHYFNPAHAGHIRTLQADIGVNAETSFLRLQKGQADLDGDFPTPIPPAEFLNVLNDPVLSKRVIRQVQVATQFVSMNTRMKPFDNPLVRRAVNYAINKRLILRLVNGRGQITDNWLPPAMAGYGKASPYPYNQAMARKLLAQAGYPNGLSTTFYSDNLSDDPRVSQAIVAQLDAVGIHAALKVLDANTWQALVMTPGKAPMTWTAWYQDFPDPNDFYEPILSCASAIPGTFNLAYYCNSKVDMLAHQLKVTVDQASRLKGYPELDRMVMADAPLAPVFNSVYYILPSSALHNFYLHNVWTLVLADYAKS